MSLGFIMKHLHLVSKGSGSSTHFHFRSKIPIDLISVFDGTRQFQISLRSTSDKLKDDISLVN